MKTTQLSLVQLRTKHNHGFAFFAGNELSRAPSLHHCSRGKLHLFEMIDSCGQQYLVVGRTHSGYVAVLFRVESIQVLLGGGTGVEDQGQLLRLRAELSKAFAHRFEKLSKAA